MKVRQDTHMQSFDSSNYLPLMVGQLGSYPQNRKRISSKIFSPTLIRQWTRGKYLYRHQKSENTEEHCINWLTEWIQ